MTASREPDWQDAAGPGLWQIGYRLRQGVDLVFWRGGPKEVEPDDYREWGCIVLDQDSKTRDHAVESEVLQASLLQTVGERKLIGDEKMWVIQEKSMSDLIDRLLRT